MRARPARVAILTDSLDPGWRHTSLRIIELLSAIWGGKHSLIIPTDGTTIDPLFWAILERFSPDYLFRYGKTGIDLKLSNPAEYDARVKEAIRWQYPNGIADELQSHRIDRELQEAWLGAFDLDAALCAEICKRLVPFSFESHISPVTYHSVPHELTKIEDVLFDGQRPQAFTTFEVPETIEPLWWQAATGRYSDIRNKFFQDEGVEERKVAITEEEISRYSKWIAGDQLNAAIGVAREPVTPFDLTMSRIGFYGEPVSIREGVDDFALVLGDTIADFCLAYCLPRIGCSAIWLPTNWISSLSKSGSLIKSCVYSAVYAAPFKARRSGGLKACSISEDAAARQALLMALKEYVGLGSNGQSAEAVEAATIVKAPRSPLTVYCLDSPNRQEIYPFEANRSIGTIRTPLPTGFVKLRAGKHWWVSEAVFPEKAVPTIPNVADSLISLPNSVNTLDTRISQRALAYACPGSKLIFNEDMVPNLGNPKLGLFDTFNAVRFIAKKEQITCELSDKGVYQRDSLSKLGGVEKAAKLFRDHEAFFRKFLDHSKRIKDVFDEGVCVAGRAYLDLLAVQKIVGGGEQAAVDLLDELVAQRVLYRGLVLLCDSCKFAAWYTLAELTDQFRCPRCRRKQFIRRANWKHPAAPQMFYKLDEIIYQFIEHDGIIVAFALDYMRAASKYPFDYSPEIRFSKEGCDYGEVDICAVWDGELVIGEVKTGNNLGRNASEEGKAIDKYRRLAVELCARRLVFCTGAPEWKDSTIEAIRKALENQLAEPIFLDAAHLRR